MPTTSPTNCVGCGCAGADDRCPTCGATRMVAGYTTQKLLFQSPKGRTYVAMAPNQERVFLKELVFAMAPDAKAIEAFQREAELLRQIRHPAVPAFVASMVDGTGLQTRFYLAEVFVDGSSLEQELPSRRYTEVDIRQIAREVLLVLGHLHRLVPPIIHRDLKPANIVRRADGRLTLVDFGVATDASVTRAGTVVGTFGYAAPEQLNGQASAASDLYALGATLVHLLARRPPWELMVNGVDLDLSRLQISGSLRRWLGHLIVARPDQRYRNAEEALRALDRPTLAMPTMPRAAMVASLAILGLGALAVPKVIERWNRHFHPPHPLDLDEACPADDSLEGKAPPDGSEQWCASSGTGTPTRDGVDVEWQNNAFVGQKARVKRISHYRAGTLEGAEVVYGFGGNKESEGFYTNGKKEGKWFITSNGMGSSEGLYVDGLREGLWTEHMFQNQKSGDGLYHLDRKEGDWKEYFPSGSVKGAGLYKDGRKEGVWLSSFESGVKERQDTFKNGQLDGPTQVWDTAGHLIRESNYANGQLYGGEVEYFPDGTKSHALTHNGPWPTGDERFYYPSGVLKKVVVHGTQPGLESKVTNYYPTGKVQDESENQGQHKVTYYESGQKKSEQSADQQNRGELHGQEWDESGKLTTEGNYQNPFNSSKTGIWKSFYPNGAVRSVENYRWPSGLDGEYRTFYPSGKPHELGYYSNGLKNGTWTEWNEKGKVIDQRTMAH